MNIIQKESQRRLQTLLRDKRVQHGIRQLELAQQLGKPQSYVSKYENGERRLDCEQVREVCLILGVSMAELISEWEKEINESK